MRTSESIKNLSKALVAFHSSVGPIPRTAVNPYHNSRYAPLGVILAAIREPLSKSGLSVTQWPEGKNALTTRLLHESGEWMEATYEMTPKKQDPQGEGSAITYMRRYALGGILSLEIEDDDDGNTATALSQKKPAARARQNNGKTGNSDKSKNSGKSKKPDRFTKVMAERNREKLSAQVKKDGADKVIEAIKETYPKGIEPTAAAFIRALTEIKKPKENTPKRKGAFTLPLLQENRESIIKMLSESRLDEVLLKLGGGYEDGVTPEASAALIDISKKIAEKANA